MKARASACVYAVVFCIY